ncbi:MAG TPA: Asp-tRNA(Asn)/Glu-tRNA(Gln) amidotransferase subunit GatB [Candidatus Paceibacterota bacterium]|jgi:aspartyl-tRNA(Asn)/glutamyl-tRNA(Gln) amidotransferase subunit B|nr:Asp-tRNA(Asn)/Glu-tRNA(Gln) amidotransferase subunit GatB [Candidatus Paceibacterota bacterium]
MPGEPAKYYYTIGLEIHAELKTNTKMFCGCKNDPDETKPNLNICPVCMAHPGALPVINKKAVEQVIKVGLALNANIADFTEFDRKNYFYPDIPKGYQISQYKYPIVSGGRLAGMDITRIHLEEDTANNKHFDGDHAEGRAGFSLIDFNRAGVPLMELVTEPHTYESIEIAAKTASNFAKEYQLILWYLGASEANMEKGEMRVEANVSISPDKDKKSIKYVEVKNLNSFRAVERAIKYEIERMTALWNEGKESEIIKETRGFDDSSQKTFSQRSKENAEDYRYFPDPDLPKLKLQDKASGFDIEKMRSKLPELPDSRRKFFIANGVPAQTIEVWISDKNVAEWAENTIKYGSKSEWQTMLNYITNDLVSLANSNLVDKIFGKTNIDSIYNLAKIFNEGNLSSRGAKDVLAIMFKEGGNPLEIATKNNMLQSNDEGALKEVVQKIINENPEPVASYKSGKENAIMSLVGKIIKESNGSANPQIVIKLLKEMLTQ